MKAPIAVVALDGAGIVVAAGVVAPGRVRVLPGAVWCVETAVRPLPAPGERTMVRPILGRCPAP